MSEFICPVATCNKELSKLQVMHFRSAHNCDPAKWIQEQHGETIRTKYKQGRGSYAIASEYEWLSSEMVREVVDTRTHNESVSGEQNPMRRPDVASQFLGEANPAKREEVRNNISKALTGHEMSEEAKEKISRKNSGNEISEAHRKKISEAASNRDTSYMQSEEYSKALSESLQGREPTYPKPYEVGSHSLAATGRVTGGINR